MTAEAARDDGTRFHFSILVAICVVYLLLNLRWIFLFRHGQPFEIDEAGYLGISLVQFNALIENGILGWLNAVNSSTPHAPLTTALSSLAYAVIGPNPLAGFLVVVLAGVATILASYALGKLIGGPQLGLLTAIVVASCPLLIDFARSYHFALPATALTTMALVALVRSDHLTNLRWSLAFGLCIGLMPLARTMTVAFVPALVLAAAIQVVAPRGNPRRGALILLLSLVVAAIIAGMWLVPNAQSVFGYLTDFGYGARSASFAPKQSLAGYQTVLYFFQNLAAYVYLPHLLLIVAGFAVLAIKTTQLFMQEGLAGAVNVIAQSKLLPLALLVAGGAAALISSQNKGSAFAAPLVPSMLLMSVWALITFSRSRAWNYAANAALVGVTIMAALPMLDLRLAMAKPWTAKVPILGPTVVTDGRGRLQRFEAEALNDPAIPTDPAIGRAWLRANEAISDKLAKHGAEQLTLLALRHYLFNMNTLSLPRLLQGKSQLRFIQIAPDLLDKTLADYSNWLSVKGACFVLTSAGEQGEIKPAIDAELMERAAFTSGFIATDQWTLPDDRVVKLWRSTRPLCSVKIVEVGDVFGRVQVLSGDELFIHPGAKTPTRFEMSLGHDDWKSVVLFIPDATLKSCPDADGTIVSIDVDGEKAWEGTVWPGYRQTAPLPGDGTRELRFAVGNNGQPNCDHLHAKFVR